MGRSGFCLVLLLLVSFPAHPAAKDIPETLKPWHDWVLWNQDDFGCPLTAEAGSKRICAWPSVLSLRVLEKEIIFSQDWEVSAESWIPLPGSKERWPAAVTVDSKAGVLVERNSKPHLRLSDGKHRVSGNIPISKVPPFIDIPPYTGLIDLKVEGKRIDHPAIDRHGRLLLAEQKPQVSRVENVLSVQVFRQLRDGHPMILETRLSMDVSGEERLETIGRLLPEGFETTAIDSALPVRITPETNLQVQLKPGSWEIIVQARHTGGKTAFTTEARENWPSQELWSFVPNRQFRIADIKGQAIDPSQTNLPPEWHAFPAFLMDKDSTVALEEKVRGDQRPDEHELFLDRELWLGFDNRQITSKEILKGTLKKLDRLSVVTGYEAGRVVINGESMLITSVNDDQGVEVRPGNLEMESVGQVKVGEALSINPWKTDINMARVTLHLPPAYTLFAARGVDSVSDAYISSWRLWDIFVVILFIVVLSKQFHWGAGLIGALYAAAVHKIPGAPPVIWLLIAVGVYVLLQYLPKNRFRQLMTRGYQLLLVVIALYFLPFAVDQARQAIYPQLERSHQYIGTAHFEQKREAPGTAGKDEPAELMRKEEISLAESDRVQVMNNARFAREAPRASASLGLRKYRQQYDKGILVQTGPGLPSWDWRRINLSWSGPVASGQTTKLIFVPPWINRSLNVLRILLFVLLAYPFARIQDLRLPLANKPTAAAALLGLLVFSNLASPGLVSADIPDESLLSEYKKRLTEKPECWPHCVSINKASISARHNKITVQLEVAALEQIALPMPIDRTHITSALITIDKKPGACHRLVKNKMMLLVPKGNHSVILSIDVSELDQLTLPFSLAPHRVRAATEGWSVTGIYEDRLSGNSVTLRRKTRINQQSQKKRLVPEPEKPFVYVNRTISMDMDWTVTTSITRLAPAVGPINLKVPLLPGESVTSSDVKVADGEVRVDFGSNQTKFAWTSVLEKVEHLTLSAVENEPYAERWQLVPSLRWHVVCQGIAPIKEATIQSQLTWWPIAGDELHLSIAKPSPVPGESLTIDAIQLDYGPRKRQSRTTLQLDFRTSQGQDYPLHLPDKAKISEVLIDGRPIIYGEEKGAILLPLRPGRHAAKVTWTMLEKLSARINTPSIPITLASNLSLKIDMPRNRWILFVSGPAMGPAVLFWGVLLVIALLSALLGHQSWSPLRPWEWFLLGAGVATSFWPVTFLIVAWFFMVSHRQQMVEKATSNLRFNLVQLSLILLTVVMLISLLANVSSSLTFSTPDMQIIGNGSYASSLKWYQDSALASIPTATVISVPMWAYRVLILFWSIWLSLSLVKWLRWGWGLFSEGDLWRKEVIEKRLEEDQTQ